MLSGKGPFVYKGEADLEGTSGRASNMICETQCTVKMQGPLFKKGESTVKRIKI